MASSEEIDSYLIKMALPYEQVGEGTWLIHPDGAHRAPIAVQIESPIVLFSIALFELAQDLRDREGLFRLLLELNADLVHASYAIENDAVVLSGAQQLENLDFNELQAMVDDMCLALDNHYDKIAPWLNDAKSRAAQRAEGSA